MSSHRSPGRRDVYATTHLNLGEIPLLARRPSPAASAVTDIEEHLHCRGGDIRDGQHLHPQQQPLLDAAYYTSVSSKDVGATASACSTSSLCDDQLSPVDAAADAADIGDDDVDD